MPTTFTTNKSFAKPNPGELLGTWGPPLNTNTGIMDAAFGGVSVIPLANSNVFLSSAQYQNQFIQFTGVLSANLTVVFPALGSFYTIINDTTGSSAFFVTAVTASTASGRAIGLPIGSMTDVMSDGVNMRFRGLPAAGTYWDYGGSSTPAWVNGCTVPPWLYCNGTTFSSATYPALTDIIGGTTLPDFRGRTSIQLNDGTNRTSSGGIDGNTLFASGGNQSFALSQANLPNTTFPVTDFGHTHTATTDANTGTAAVHQFISGGAPIGANSPATISLNPAFSGVRVFSGGSGAQVGLVPPTTITGIRMVRAA